MTKQIPKFYQKWLHAKMNVSLPSEIFEVFYFDEHRSTYLIVAGDDYAPACLYIYTFKSRDGDGKKIKPVFVRGYEIAYCRLISELTPNGGGGFRDRFIDSLLFREDRTEENFF